ncbi:ANTAR domain-containing protein [Streptomyces mirabilis]|uniref:ANTAR domain-containing protein n=2 Tax=Streptomyces mirabilis TaxID=68239 RepID=UPI00339F5606
MRGTTAVLASSGEIVHGCTTVLDPALGKLPGVTDALVLDMAEVTFMDTAGLQFLERLENYSSFAGIPYGPSTGAASHAASWKSPACQSLPPHPTSHAPRCFRTPANWSPPCALIRDCPQWLRNAQSRCRGCRRRLQLQQAVASRPIIDQSRGILMAVETFTADQAWGVLRDASQHANTKLRSVAAALVAVSTGGPTPAEPLRTAPRDAVKLRHRCASTMPTATSPLRRSPGAYT